MELAYRDPPKMFSFGNMQPSRRKVHVWGFDVSTCTWLCILAKKLTDKARSVHPASGLIVEKIKERFRAVHTFLLFVEDNTHIYYKFGSPPDCTMENFVAVIHANPESLRPADLIDMPTGNATAVETWMKQQVAYTDINDLIDYVKSWDEVNYYPPPVIPPNASTVQQLEKLSGYSMRTTYNDPVITSFLVTRNLQDYSSNPERYPTTLLVSSLVHNKDHISKKNKKNKKSAEIETIATPFEAELNQIIDTDWSREIYPYPVEHKYGGMLTKQGDGQDEDYFQVPNRSNYMASMFGSLVFNVQALTKKAEEHDKKFQEVNNRLNAWEANNGIPYEQRTATKKLITDEKTQRDQEKARLDQEKAAKYDLHEKTHSHQLGGPHRFKTFKEMELESAKNAESVKEAAQMIIDLRTENSKLKRKRECDPQTRDDALSLWLTTSPEFVCRKLYNDWLTKNELDDEIYVFKKTNNAFATSLLACGYGPSTRHGTYGKTFKKG